MTAVYDATWYDEVMVEDGSPAMLPLEESPWLTTYEALAGMIDPHEEVVDLGCGTGRFIELLRRQGHYAKITGIDWSATALAEAEAYATTTGAGVPDPQWVHQDLGGWQPDPLRAGNAVFVCSEVLEHLEDDLGLIKRLPPGHRFLLTVPNFNSESHIRIFRSVSDIWDRYAHLLLFRLWRMVGSDRQGIHICEARRRGDSW
jgi:trans-aconitate methyltransferase